MSDDEDPYDDSTVVANVPLQSKHERRLAHVVKRDDEALKRERDRFKEPTLEAQGKGGELFSGENEYTSVEEGQPEPPQAMLEFAEQASLAVAPPHDPGRGFMIVTSGGDLGRKVGLPKGRTTVGRGLDCDIVLTDISVSRRHVYIERSTETEGGGDLYIICDLGSGNGTEINHRDRRGEVVVENGDIVQIGNTVFSLEIPSSGPLAAVSERAKFPEATAQPPERLEIAAPENPAYLAQRHEGPAPSAPMSLDGSFESKFGEPARNGEGSTATRAGKGLASETDGPGLNLEEEELATNIVGGAELLSEMRGYPAASPVSSHDADAGAQATDEKEIQSAAFAAIASIETLPPSDPSDLLEINSEELIPLAEGNLRPRSTSPYPIPDRPAQDRAARDRPAQDRAAQDRPAQDRAAQGGYAHGQGPLSGQYIAQFPGQVPMPNTGRGGPSPSSSSNHYPVPAPMAAGASSSQNISQGRPGMGVPTMSQPMTAGARSEVGQRYSPASSVSEDRRGKWLTGILGVSLALVLGGVVYALANQESGEKNSKSESEISVETDAASAPTVERNTERIEPSGVTAGNNPEAEIAKISVLVADGGGHVEEPQALARPNVATSGTPKKTSSETAKNSQETVQIKGPKTQNDPTKSKPKPKPRSQPRFRKSSARKSSARKSSARESRPRRNSERVNVSSTKSSARALYKKRKFDQAASILNKAANKLNDDDLAMKLEDTADAYKQVGSYLSKAGRSQNSNPVEALDLYKKALARDKKFAAGTLAQVIRERLGKVAPKAAKAFMSRGQYSQAKKAADTAARYDQEGAVEAVYRSLERKANSLIKKALKAKKHDDYDEAKDLLREATSIAPKGTRAYDKCRKELRRL